MTGDFYGPVEVISSLRRRASTEYSTGLDYSSCSRVDEDIITRVRSLLLSRNDHCPPRTPNTSDEPYQSYRESSDIIGLFDFSTAKSIAKLARQLTERLSVPEIKRAQSKSAMLVMESRQPTQSNIKSILRTSSSVNDLKAPVDPDYSPEPKNKFRFPKLVLVDKKKPELEGIKSCIEISHHIPSDDAELHEHDLNCCPPCDPQDLQPSKYLIKHTKLPSPGLEVEAADLACFMAGCDPGMKNCEKHRRRSNSFSTRSASYDRRIEEDFNSIPDGLAKLGITVKSMKKFKAKFPLATGGDGHNTTSGSRQNTDERENSSVGDPIDSTLEIRHPIPRMPGRNLKSMRSPIERALSPISSVTSGSTMDAFPLALQSLELAAREEGDNPFSTTVATNFSLPGYKSKRASQTLRTKLAEITARPDQHSTKEGIRNGETNLADTEQPGSVRTATDDGKLTSSSKQSIKPEEASAKEDHNKTQIRKSLGSNRVPTNISTFSTHPIFAQAPTKEDAPSRHLPLSVARKLVPSTDLKSGIETETRSQKQIKVSFSPKPVAAEESIDRNRKHSDTPLGPKHTSPALSSKQSDAEISDSIRRKKSDASLRSTNASLKSKPYSPSLLSGASRTSVTRHALLKSSVTEVQPVDTGLPVPPLLSAISSLSEQVMPSEPAYDEILKSAGVDAKGKASKRETEFFDVTESMGKDPKETDKSGASEGRFARKMFTLPKSTILKDSDLENNHETAGNVSEAGRFNRSAGNREGARLPISGHFTNLQKAKDLVDSVKGQIQEAQEQMIQAIAFERLEGAPSTANNSGDPCRLYKPTSEDAFRSISKQGNPSVTSPNGLVSPKSHELADCELPAEGTNIDFAIIAGDKPMSDPRPDPANGPTWNAILDSTTILEQSTGTVQTPGEGQAPLETPEDTKFDQAQPLFDPSNAAYWGFAPAVKEAVQAAVQIAVRNAVQDVVVPPGMDKSSNEYRKLVSDSLSRASKKADDYVQQASARNNALSSHGESEATVVFSGRATKQGEPIDSGPVSLPRGSNQAPDSLPLAARSPSVPGSYPGSVSSRDQENDRGQVNEISKMASPHSEASQGRYSGSAHQTLSSRPMSPHELETIALDSDSKLPVEDTNEARKFSKAYPWKKKPSDGYTAIPTRNSSRNRVLSPKTKATNSFAKVSAQGSLMRSRKRSSERLISRRSQGLRSASSAGSLRSAVSAEKDKEMDVATSKQALSRRNSVSSVSHDLSEDKLGRKNTVHWLKDLLSTNGPYEPRFTALPPRTRNSRNSFSGSVRSHPAPVKPVAGLQLGKTPGPSYAETDVTKPQETKVKQDKRADISETFTRTIKDLENLMTEALLIARQAADSPDASSLQPGFEESINALRDLQKDQPKVGGTIPFHFGVNRTQSRISVVRCSDSDSSYLSIHESLRGYSGSSASDRSDEDDGYSRSPTHIRSITVSPRKVRSRNSSGWPPTGRVSTPYPPASCPESRESINVEGRIDPIRNNSLNQIKAADPRSMRIETNVDISKMSTTSKQVSSNRNSKTIHQSGSRQMTAAPFPLIDPEYERLGENDPRPEFRTLEPFNSRPSGGTRKSSSKSPRRLSPERATVSSTTAPDTAFVKSAGDTGGRRDVGPLPQLSPRRGTFIPVCIKEHSEEDHQAIRAKLASKDVPGKQEVRDYILQNRHPPITPRASSWMLRKRAEQGQGQGQSKALSGVTSQTGQTGKTYNWQDIDHTKIGPCSRGQTIAPEPEIIDPNRRLYSHSLDGSQITHSEILDFDTGYGVRQRGGGGESSRSRAHEAVELRDSPDPNLPPTNKGEPSSKKNHFSLGGKRHVSLRDHHVKGFSLARSHKRQTIARDWSPGRKRFVATVACISTALIGILVGIYAGETPSIQYYIVDFHHYTVLGNVFFFVGLAIPTFLFWPLPLLHGRKPYILGAMSLAMPLLFPQALAVGQLRSPYVSTWRVGLIMSRALMGFCLGFANMNFKQMLTDLFGASLQSTNPHQEHVDEFDVRRHGGGMGIWLGLWTWSALGSIGIGFLIGAVIINHLNPAWGFYVSIIIIAFVMLLNVLCPEVRRSAFRRSVAEVVNGADVSRRLARGEVKMHMVKTGPKWWGEEFHYGVMLTQKMLRQPGFLIMALYTAWIYGQQVLITLLLGALMSKDYKFTSPAVGASAAAIPLGALVAIPFQKASLFSRARQLAPVSDDGTFKKRISWTSHMVRRSIFMLVLPIAGLGYTLCSGGPPIPFILPILFAGLIGFLSNLAMAECHGILMETFDTSDLQPGMTGRSRGSAGSKATSKRTNYSSFPRVASAFSITQGFGYLIAAGASGVGGVLTRHLGQQAATGVMAGILLILSILLLGTLIRFKDVQIIPDSRKDEMEQYHNARRVSTIRREEGIQEEEPWRPIIIGNPHHTTRRMCLLELGSLTRFSEIRIKNKLVDEQSLEAKHPNQAAINDLKNKIHEKEMEVINHVRRSLSRHSSRGSRRSRSDNPEQGDLGGHREMLNRGGSGNESGRPALSRGASGRGSERKGTSMARKGIEE